MAEFFEFSREAMNQDDLQRNDVNKKPYDVFGWGSEDTIPLPRCLTAMDDLPDDELDL
jgi:hypothetical protein